MTGQGDERTGGDMEEYRQLIETTFRSLKDAVFVVKHPERVIETCNPAAEQMFGWDASELVGSSTRRLHVDDAHYERFGRESEQALAETGRYQGEFRMQRADGSTLFTEHVVSFVGSSDDPDRAVSVVRDITERKEQERQLKLKSRAMDDSPIGIVLTDATNEDNPICYVNEGFVRLTGYHGENILGRNCRFLQGRETDPETVKQIRTAIDAEEPVEVEIRNYRADGEMFWNHLLITPVRNRDGDVTHFIGYQRDVSERKEMEVSLRERERLYRTLFEDANVGFLIEGLDDVVLDANYAACDLLGYTREELQDRALSDITPEDIQESCGERGIVQHQLDKHGTSVYYGHYLHKDSTRIPVEKSKTPISYQGNDAVLVCVRDRTELERLRKQDERKSTFVSQVTHDLRTPLNSISGMGNLLKDTDLSPQQQRHLQTILNAARNMERLTNDILDLNRIERGEIILDEEPFNLHRLLGEVISLYSQQVEEQEVMLSTRISEDVPEQFIGDPDRLKQILHNLVDNAIKHTQEGSIVISVDLAERREATVVLSVSVSDTGRGIPETELNDIFEEHMQVETASSGSGQGLGIGLSICQNLVELMNGDIAVESEVGEGTTFTFTVELKETMTEAETASVALDDADVLLVEDNALIRNVFRTYLEERNMNCDELESGEAALERLTDQQGPTYDVVFMDRRLGHVSGVEVLRQVAETPGAIDPNRIYIISGDPSEQVQELIDPLSCAGVMEKPIDESELIDAVSSVVRARNKQVSEKGVNELQEDIRLHSPDSFHILVVDDDQNTRTLLKELLSPVTDDITFVTNGNEAVKERLEHPPDLILMDLEMPEMDGLEATEVIRRNEDERDLSHVPLITQTARAMKHVETTCLEAGADKFVRKPIKRRRLYRSIRDVLAEE